MGLLIDGIEFNNLTADPSSPVEGEIWFNTTDNVLRIYVSGKVRNLNTKIETVAFAGSNPYLNTTSPTYTIIAMFHFPGTDKMGVPDAMKVVAWTTATTYDVKIYDVVNSLTIAEITAQTNSTAQIVDMGTLSNLPTGSSIFEIQVLRAGGGEVRFASLNVDW